MCPSTTSTRCIPYKYVPCKDEFGRFDTTFTVDQDKMAWETQGPIAKRHLERLGKSDVGIILYRKLLNEQAKIVADGGDPMNTFHTKEAAENINIPTEHMALGRDQVPRIKFIPLEAGVSGAEANIDYAVESWYVNEKAGAGQLVRPDSEKPLEQRPAQLAPRVLGGADGGERHTARPVATQEVGVGDDVYLLRLLGNLRGEG